MWNDRSDNRSILIKSYDLSKSEKKTISGVRFVFVFLFKMNGGILFVGLHCMCAHTNVYRPSRPRLINPF